MPSIVVWLSPETNHCEHDCYLYTTYKFYALCFDSFRVLLRNYVQVLCSMMVGRLVLLVSDAKTLLQKK